MKETGEAFGDRAHIIYVNGEYKGEDPIGLLMADFRESDPAKMHYAELAKRVNALKNSEEEVRKMCQAMEVTYNEGRVEGIVMVVQLLMKRKGLSAEEAMDDLEIPQEDRRACAEYMAHEQESE